MSAQIKLALLPHRRPVLHEWQQHRHRPWINVSAAFDHSVASNSTPIAGYDWTQAFPGPVSAGHSVKLTISQEMPISRGYRAEFYHRLVVADLWHPFWSHGRR